VGDVFPVLWVGCNLLYGAIVGGTRDLAQAAGAESRPIAELVRERRRKAA
jgi:hypothetical protein